MAESVCAGESEQENEQQQHTKLVDKSSDEDSCNDLADDTETLREEIRNESSARKRHSVDVTGLRDTCSSEAECRMTSNLVSGSKSEDDMRTKCKRKNNYNKPYENKRAECRRKVQQQHSSGLKQTVARVLGKSVPDQFRSFFDLFSRSDTLNKDKQNNWRRAAQRKPRYKETEKSVGRYEPITIYTKLKKNQWKLTMPSNSICYDDVELTDDQRRELRKAFLMFEKGGKNKMAARDLGELLRCLGWNPSERELEEARHELVVSARGSVSFSEIERYVARRGGICNGCKDEDDIQEAFQVLDQDGDGKISVNKFKHFMTTLGEKMSDTEVDEILQSLRKDKDDIEYLEYKDLIEGLEAADLEDS